MFLGKINGTFIRHSQIKRQLTNKEHCQIRITHQQVRHYCHRYQTNNRCFKRRGICQVIFLSEISTVTKILHGFDHADDLAATADTFLKNLYLTSQQTHHVPWFVALAIDQLVTFEMLDRRIITENFPLFVGQYSPYFC